MGGNRAGEAIEIVTAFEHGDDAGFAVFVGGLHHKRSEIGEIRIGQ